MAKIWIPALLAVSVVVSGNAQTLVEHALAAAGGSAAGVAGKKVSDGVDKILGKAADLAKDAVGKEDTSKRKILVAPVSPEVKRKDGTEEAKTTAVTVDPKSNPSVIVGHFQPRPPKQQAAWNGPAAKPATVAVTPGAPAPAQVSAPSPPQPTTQDLRALTGASRDQVFERMGRPAVRITSSEDGKLVETYSFKNSSGRLGSARLVDGTVTEVRPSN